MSNNLPVAVSMSDMQVMAKALATSGLFGVKNETQALALMLVASAEGISPALACRDYHIIEGRPALRADAILARFQTAGGSVKWVEMTDHRVEGIFSHPQGGSVSISWDLATAKAAGLSGRKMWSSYPRAMMRSRVISEGVRSTFPGVIAGTYSIEEAQDMIPENAVSTVINEVPLTIEAKTTAQEASTGIQAALAGKVNKPIRTTVAQPIIDVQPEVKAKPVSAGRDALAASVLQDLTELSTLTQDPVEMILESLTKGTMKTTAALSTAMFSHLQKLATLVTEQLETARLLPQDSFDPFEDQPNPFETN